MSFDLPLQIAETIQTAHINRAPDVRHDLNPSTAASQKIPVTIESTSRSQELRGDYEHVEELDDEEIDGDEDEEDDIPSHVLRPVPRRPSMPPLPDLRFEQSYLASIAGAETWGRVAYITIRDQVLLPLAQGTLWALALHGWRHWNKNAQLSGGSVGARIRRWWWGVNNWPLDDKPRVVGGRRR